MTQTIFAHQLANGLVLVAEPMDWVESAAFTLNLPAGCCHDPEDRAGLASFVCEMVQRGCGDRDSRQFVEALDRLGVDRSASVTQAHSSYAAAMLSENVGPALAIYADMVRKPHLPADQLEDARQVCFQEVQAIEDDLAQKTMLHLRRQTYGEPWGRAPSGDLPGIEAVRHADLTRFHAATYVPQQTILSVAGRIDWHRLQETVEALFGDWTGPQPLTVRVKKQKSEYLHLTHDSNQTQIGIAYKTIPYRHPDYFQARGAVGVLSDGMSSRLFTEVREKRGLCYSVYAAYHSLRDDARVMCYAGTSADRAQETLDVTLAELVRLTGGIEEAELDRLKARTKSALIMQQESSTSRSGAIAADWYYLGRVRSIQEINALIDGLTCASINTYLKSHPPGEFDIVTLGPEPLEVRCGVPQADA